MEQVGKAFHSVYATLQQFAVLGQRVLKILLLQPQYPYELLQYRVSSVRVQQDTHALQKCSRLFRRLKRLPILQYPQLLHFVPDSRKLLLESCTTNNM